MRAQSRPLEYYSLAISLVMVVMLLVNFVFNNVYLAYPMIDFLQLLFILLFVAMEYPPNLNYFLYGFRFAHYLFLPSIFNVTTPLQDGPGKFGTIVADVNFLRNTGHSFLLLFIVLGLGLLLLGLQAALAQCVKRQSEEEVETSRLSGLTRVVQSVIYRFKFNYLNDLLYVVYFYLGLFTFAQYLDFPGEAGYDRASSGLAVVSLVLLVLLPLLLSVYLVVNLAPILDNQPCPQLKCLLAGIDRNSHFGVSLRLLQYPRKLLSVLVLIVGQSNSLYFYAWLIITSCLFAVMVLAFRPYRWRLENIFYILVESCLMGLVAIISAIGLKYEQLSPHAKQSLGWVFIALAILFTLLLLVYNFTVLVVELIHYCTGVNYIEEWTRVKVADYSSEDSNSEHSKKNEPGLDSNILILKRDGTDRPVDENSDQDYNPFLQEGDGAPRILMKCVKTVAGEKPEDSDHSDFNDA